MTDKVAALNIQVFHSSQLPV